MENAEKFFETYCDFVTKVTSNPSLKIEDLKNLVRKYNHSIQNDNPKVLSKSLNLLLEKINDLPEKNRPKQTLTLNEYSIHGE